MVRLLSAAFVCFCSIAVVMSGSMCAQSRQELSACGMKVDCFWNAFRIAALATDTASLVSMASFPLNIKGVLDSDPIVHVARKKFGAVFIAFLGQWDGVVGVARKSERDVILECVDAHVLLSGGEYMRVGGMEFKKTKRGWLLVSLYLDPDVIDSLHLRVK